MTKICLTLPTNRACAAMISAVGAEAAYAASRFDVEVILLILDSSDSYALHANVLRSISRPHGVTVLHLDEASQRGFLRSVVAGDDRLFDLMLPHGVSYGACTNRAFLIASALGCGSVHRRDSDSRYQVFDGAEVFPIHQELASIGKPASAAEVSTVDLSPAEADKPVVLVGGSFIGELSVDIGEIKTQDPEIYYDIVGLWAPDSWPEKEKRQLVDQSFTGAGHEPFTGDDSVLTVVDPMRVDMCNVSFHQVHEQVPLPPATDTIGSDYFLLHLVHAARLPGVSHNRHIVNFHTPERKTGAGLRAYHLRLTKFFLSMPYLHFIYQEMALAGAALLDSAYRVHAPVIAKLARESIAAAGQENARRLTSLAGSYRRLGGKYASFADHLAVRGPQLLVEAAQDVENFAVLTDAWEELVTRAKATPCT